MYKFIQVKLSQQVIRKTEHEITVDELLDLISGANLALGTVGYYFNYTDDVDSYGVQEGTVVVDMTKAQNSFFKEGFILVYDLLDSMGKVNEKLKQLHTEINQTSAEM